MERLVIGDKTNIVSTVFGVDFPRYFAGCKTLSDGTRCAVLEYRLPKQWNDGKHPTTYNDLFTENYMKQCGYTF